MNFYKFILSLLVFGFLLSSFSCKKEDSKVNNLEQYVTLDKQSVKLNVGKKLTVTPSLGDNASPKRTHQWVSDNPGVVEVIANEDNSGIRNCI